MPSTTVGTARYLFRLFSISLSLLSENPVQRHESLFLRQLRPVGPAPQSPLAGAILLAPPAAGDQLLPLLDVAKVQQIKNVVHFCLQVSRLHEWVAGRV